MSVEKVVQPAFFISSCSGDGSDGDKMIDRGALWSF